VRRARTGGRCGSDCDGHFSSPDKFVLLPFISFFHRFDPYVRVHLVHILLVRERSTRPSGKSILAKTMSLDTTYLTSTSSSSPASLLYSGSVLTLLPLSVLLIALPRDCLPLPLLALELEVLRARPDPASSSAVSETSEVARRFSARRSRLLRSHLLS
jgi:hypothetical protein